MNFAYMYTSDKLGSACSQNLFDALLSNDNGQKHYPY